VTDLVLVTPTYGPDLGLCRTLVDSVRAFVAPGIEHLVLPDARDIAGFHPLAGDGIRVIAKEEFIPAGFFRLPKLNGWMHPRLRRPVGGWLMQQLVKLNAARMLDARCLLFVDSDVAFVRPVTAEIFVGESVRTYRLPAAITPAMTSHQEWSAAAAELLGLPAETGTLPDYISQLVSWDATAARSLLARIDAVGQRPWYLQVAARRRVSEYLLYGTWVDRAAPQRPSWVEPTSLCHSYWDSAPLDAEGVEAFISSFPADAVAVGLQSFSLTDPAIRAQVLRRLREGAPS
jgi:hypothetical protein